MKESSTKRSLGTQLLMLGAIPAILMFVGLMVFFTNARLSDARQDLFDSTQKLVDNMAPALEYAVVSGNRDILSEILEESISGTSLEWIRVTDVVGTELARGRPGTVRCSPFQYRNPPASRGSRQ